MFEKKICGICGGEIGLLGNRKLEDGNMVLSYAEYLESLSLKMGSTEVVQNDAHTKKSFLYNKQVENFLYTATGLAVW